MLCTSALNDKPLLKKEMKFNFNFTWILHCIESEPAEIQQTQTIWIWWYAHKTCNTVIKKEGIRIQLFELIELEQKLERGVKHATVVQK
jgi:hypothetical protein